MDGLLVVSFSAIFYAFVKKGLAFGSTFVSRVAARANLPHRVFCLSRSRSLFVGSIALNWEYSLHFGMIMNILLLSTMTMDYHPPLSCNRLPFTIVMQSTLSNKHTKSIA